MSKFFARRQRRRRRRRRRHQGYGSTLAFLRANKMEPMSVIRSDQALLFTYQSQNNCQEFSKFESNKTSNRLNQKV